MRGSRNGENKFKNFLENERQLRGELAFLYMPGVFVLLVYFCFILFLLQYHNSGYNRGSFRNTLSFAKLFPVAISPSLSSRGTTFKTPERNKGSTTQNFLSRV